MRPVPSSSVDPAPFELRNATLTLVALVLATTDLELLSEALEERFGPTPALFDHDPVVIDLAAVAAASEPIDFERLRDLLLARRMLPVGIEGGSPDQVEAALAVGLGQTPTLVARPAPEAPVRASSAGAGARAGAGPRASADAETAPAAAGPGHGRAAPPAGVAEESAPVAAVPTLVIDRPLRSGQQVYARGGDLVVMAAVNFGAEVIADGNIHVYAPLRGRAVAGARGDTSARIFSTCMEPQLVAIAGIYRTTDTALPPAVHGKPAQVRLDGDALVVEALAS